MIHTPIDSADDRNDPSDLTESDRHRLLMAERRRATLEVLATRNEPVDLDDLAASLARREDASESPGNDHVERVAASLYHSHLPMMADLGVIDYDPSSKRIYPGQTPSDLLTG